MRAAKHDVQRVPIGRLDQSRRIQRFGLEACPAFRIRLLKPAKLAGQLLVLAFANGLERSPGKCRETGTGEERDHHCAINRSAPNQRTTRNHASSLVGALGHVIVIEVWTVKVRHGSARICSINRVGSSRR